MNFQAEAVRFWAEKCPNDICPLQQGHDETTLPVNDCNAPEHHRQNDGH